jgi:hypothetical protein
MVLPGAGAAKRIYRFRNTAGCRPVGRGGTGARGAGAGCRCRAAAAG